MFCQSPTYATQSYSAVPYLDVSATLVTGQRVDDTNALNQERVGVTSRTVKLSGDTITYTFQPKSFTQILVPLGQ